MSKVIGKLIGKKDGFDIFKIVEEVVDNCANKANNDGHGSYIQTTLKAVDDVGNVVKTWVRKVKTDLFPDVKRRNVAAVAPTRASWEIFDKTTQSLFQCSDRRFWRWTKDLSGSQITQIDLTPNGKKINFKYTKITSSETNNYTECYKTWSDSLGKTIYSKGRNKNGYFSTAPSGYPEKPHLYISMIKALQL